jgi:hypothetical protein
MMGIVLYYLPLCMQGYLFEELERTIQCSRAELLQGLVDLPAVFVTGMLIVYGCSITKHVL